jgi:DNA-binding response OmpR family regulator
VVEDDEDLRLAVTGALRGAGFAVDAVGDLPQADEALWVNSYDCAVFDRILPAGDALGFLKVKRTNVPVLFLTARDSMADRLAGLEHGDDYLVKPFAVDVLIARVRSLCRRTATHRPGTLHCADLTMNLATHQIHRAGVLLTLTTTEFAVLELLLTHQGTPVKRRDMLDHGWDPMSTPTTNVLDVVIAQLRRKLGEPRLIHTVRGIGYVLTAGHP